MQIVTVSILVLLDSALRPGLDRPPPRQKFRFNPCSAGFRSETMLAGCFFDMAYTTEFQSLFCWIPL